MMTTMTSSHMHLGWRKGKGKQHSKSPESATSVLMNMEKRLCDVEQQQFNIMDKQIADADQSQLEGAKNTISKMKKQLDAIKSNLKCLICKAYMSSTDSVILPCCCNFGGCRACIAEWLGESATCPHCHAQKWGVN